MTFDQLLVFGTLDLPRSEVEARIRAPVRSRLAVNTAEAAIDGAAAGLGVTRVLSYQVAASGRGRRD